ncbi:hypothetical protein ACT691_07990 [Vibrio metschnikovii]
MIGKPSSTLSRLIPVCNGLKLRDDQRPVNHFWQVDWSKVVLRLSLPLLAINGDLRGYPLDIKGNSTPPIREVKGSIASLPLG